MVDAAAPWTLTMSTPGQDGELTFVSSDSNGQPLPDSATNVDVSADGRYAIWSAPNEKP